MKDNKYINYHKIQAFVDLMNAFSKEYDYAFIDGKIARGDRRKGEVIDDILGHRMTELLQAETPYDIACLANRVRRMEYADGK